MVRPGASRRIARKRKIERIYARGVCTARRRVERVAMDRERERGRGGEGALTPTRNIRYASVAHQLFGNGDELGEGRIAGRFGAVENGVGGWRT